jgi:hypothetical protein
VKNAYLIIACFFVLVSCQEKSFTSSISWMEGTWSQIDSTSIYQEIWHLKVADSGLYFEGNGIWSAQDSIIFEEKIHLYEKDSKLIYKVIASVDENHTGTIFESTTISDSLLVFENPTHDFPKKIIYKLTKNNLLEIEVSGNGEKMEFELTKK